jgi:hypothetical protein
MLIPSAQPSAYLTRKRAMLRTIKKNMFDVVAGFAMIAVVLYLAAITYVMPLPENAMKRLSEFSLNVMDVVLACVVWLISFLP